MIRGARGSSTSTTSPKSRPRLTVWPRRPGKWPRLPAAPAAETETKRLDIAKGLILKDEARLLRELEKQHKVRIYLVGNRTTESARSMASPIFPRPSRRCRVLSPSVRNRGWATEFARCNQLRGRRQRRSCS